MICINLKLIIYNFFNLLHFDNPKHIIHYFIKQEVTYNNYKLKQKILNGFQPKGYSYQSRNIEAEHHTPIYKPCLGLFCTFPYGKIFYETSFFINVLWRKYISPISTTKTKTHIKLNAIANSIIIILYLCAMLFLYFQLDFRHGLRLLTLSPTSNSFQMSNQMQIRKSIQTSLL